MLSNLLKPSLEGQNNPNLKTSSLEQNTIDTLSSLPATHSTDVRIYYSESTESDLLHHSLSHGNVEWLEKQLSIVHKLALSSSNSQVQNKSQQYFQSLDQLSQKTSIALQKISQHRKILHQKLMGYLMLKSKQSNKKNLIRSNMFKYKSALLVLKNLKERKIKSETQVIQLKSRLKTSGLMLVPSLIQKSMIRLALDSLTGRECPVQITEPENLRFIVDNFMGDRRMISKIWSDTNTDPHELYLKFKTYILLKNRIDDRKSTQSLDKLCQEHISTYYANNLNRVAEIEHNKIRGLVQCDSVISKFWQNQSTFHISLMLKNVLKFIRQLQLRGPVLVTELVNQFGNSNKKIRSFDKLSISANGLNLLISDMNRFLSIEQVQRILSLLEDRRYLFQTYSTSMKLKFCMKDIEHMVLSQSLKFMVEPIKKIIVEINKLIYNKVEKHYHNSRVVNKSVMTWTLLMEHTNVNNKQLSGQLEQYAEMHKDTIVQTLDNNKEWESTRMSKGSTSVGEFMAVYNEAVGQTYMYIANKLANLISADKKLGRYETSTHPFSLSKLTNLWIELICEGICNHLLSQAQPANVLQNLSFLQDEIIKYVDTEYTLDSQLHKLSKQLEGSCRLKGKFTEQCMEQTFVKILQLNLRVRDHPKLMAICKQIKVEDQVRKMNEEIYSKVIKNIIS